MALTPGTRLGPYEVTGLLGAGGMGEVYRAHDSRLRRDVAIKTSAERFNERFAREARTVAALNHPNICTLHDVGPDYLVMELVDGASPQGPLPVDDVLRIAAQIAAALDAAHDKGIVHRDLKPANVKITASGVLKVLDFGLAKVTHDASFEATKTLSLTQEGVTLGTPAYMAPEQAQGKEVDRRVDVWAFGVLLYELLTGQRPFNGDSAQSTLVAVMTAEPDLSKVPASLHRLLRACLKKDPRERLSSIGNWRLLLDDSATLPALPAAPVSRPIWPWMIAAAGVVAGALGLFALVRRGPALEPPPAVRFDVPVPGGVGAQAMFALSPDARNLAIAAPEDGQIRLRVRPLDSAQARVLAGAEGARYLFWKPDGSAIGFIADGALKTIPLDGGSPTTITNVDSASIGGATWSSRGVIVLAQSRDLYTVADQGGNLTLLYGGPGIPSVPQFLPDGRHFLYRDSGVFIGALDGTPPRKIMEERGGTNYADGHLLFVRQGRLVAQPFDVDTLTLNGAATPITNENMVSPDVTTSAGLSVTPTALAYQVEVLEQLAWTDRSGVVTEKIGEPRTWQNFRVSADQSKIAMTVSSQGKPGVATFDVRRGTVERLTSHETADLVPVFSPDGTTVAFTSFRNGRFAPFVTSASNSERLIADMPTTGGFPLDWSPDGESVLFWADGDIWVLSPNGGPQPYVYAKSAADERDGAFSPDSRWIAYSSNESGRYEVYLKAFPEAGRRRYAVSSQGGSNPGWRRDGKELYFVSGDGHLTAMPVTLTGGSVEFGRDQRLFAITPGSFHRTYEPSFDGRRFLVATPAGECFGDCPSAQLASGNREVSGQL